MDNIHKSHGVCHSEQALVMRFQRQFLRQRALQCRTQATRHILNLSSLGSRYILNRHNVSHHRTVLSKDNAPQSLKQSDNTPLAQCPVSLEDRILLLPERGAKTRESRGKVKLSTAGPSSTQVQQRGISSVRISLHHKDPWIS